MEVDRWSGFYVFGPSKRPWALQISIEDSGLTLGIYEADGTCRDIAFLKFEGVDEALQFVTLVRIWAEKLLGDGRPYKDMLFGLDTLYGLKIEGDGHGI